LTVTDDTNMANADVILVEQDDGTLHKTTLNGSPSSNAITLTAGLAKAASAGNAVYTWPAAATITHKLVKLINVNRRVTDFSNVAINAGYMEGLDTPINIIGDIEYQSFPTKLQTGIPVNVHLRQETVNPELYAWPTGGTGKVHSLVIEYNAYLQDLDASSNNLDIPAEGVNAVCWAFASEMGPEYGLTEAELRRLERTAQRKIDKFLDFQVEDAPVVFSK
jgi:hypothetical protein